MSFDDVSAEDLSGPDTTVIGSLRSRIAPLRPAIGITHRVEQSVFLLDAELQDMSADYMAAKHQSSPMDCGFHASASVGHSHAGS